VTLKTGNRATVSWPSSVSEVAELTSFLRTAVEADADALTVATVDAPQGGASWETAIVTAAVTRQGHTQSRRYAVKRAPLEGPLAPYSVDKEAVVLGALAGSDVPVPDMLAHGADPGDPRRSIMVMSFVSGEAPDLSRVERWSVWQHARLALGGVMIDTLARLGRFRWQDAGLADVLGVRGTSVRRVHHTVDHQLALLEAAEPEAPLGEPFWLDVGYWLKDNVPLLQEHELVLVHGDYRFGNLIWHGTELRAVIDWELAQLGDPMQDLAFLCMPLSRLRRPDLLGMALTPRELLDCCARAAFASMDERALLFYMVYWQFMQGTFLARRARILQTKGPGPLGWSLNPMLMPNIAIRQTAALLDDFAHDRLRL
jgi:aminoglycoside phosphotransferase (APT) family kinase protein